MKLLMGGGRDTVKLYVRSLKTGKSVYYVYYKNGKRTKECTGVIIPNNEIRGKVFDKKHRSYLQELLVKKIKSLQSMVQHRVIDIDKSLMQYIEELRIMKEAERPNTGRPYVALLSHLKEYCSPSYPLVKVDKFFLLGFIKHLSKTTSLKRKTSKPLSNNTQKKIYALLASAIKKAYQSDLIDTNPTTKISPSEHFKKEPRVIKRLTREEVKNLQKTDLNNLVVRRAYLFSCFTGLRFSDIKKLCWSDIRRSGNVCEIVIKQQKTGSEIIVPLCEEALKQLPKSKAKKGYVFKRLPTDTAVNAILKKWGECAGVKEKVTFHTARHTYATMLVTAGVDIKRVQELMGHASIQATMVYAHVEAEAKREAITQLNNFFKN